MKYLATIFALSAAISAIDISIIDDSHCDGPPMATWKSVQPDTCLSYHRPGAYAFDSVPTNWAIITRAYKKQGCPGNSLANQFHSNGKDRVCIGWSWPNSGYNGAGYSFNDQTKRSESSVVREKRCIKPDLLHLQDGQTYNSTGLEDDVVELMVS
jgi:hypothetical protein